MSTGPSDGSKVESRVTDQRNGHGLDPDSMAHPKVYATQLLAAWSNTSPQVRITMAIAAAIAGVAIEVENWANVCTSVVGLSLLALGAFWTTTKINQNTQDVTLKTKGRRGSKHLPGTTETRPPKVAPRGSREQ